MDVVIPILTCITCFILGALVCFVAMQKQRDVLEQQLDGMMSIINAYRYNSNQTTGNMVTSASQGIYAPTNHAYYEDDSEVGSRVWMDHVTDPFVSEAAAALGLLEEKGDEFEVRTADGSLAMTFTDKLFKAFTEPITNP